MNTNSRKQVGNWGETLAAQYLEQLGWKLAARNWRCEAGEIDILAWDGAVLVVVEVRTRRSLRYGTPEESITPGKAQRLWQCAEYYLSELPAPIPACRIDLIAVDLSQHPPQVRHSQDILG
ncbi:MAG TPA: YraN family protein [Anaerolineales bacterium]|nr:YraN family protein [Anaerolineales bacterium]